MPGSVMLREKPTRAPYPPATDGALLHRPNTKRSSRLETVRLVFVAPS